MKLSFYLLVIWYSLASIVWMFKHPKANEFTLITNAKKVMLFQTNEDLK